MSARLVKTKTPGVYRRGGRYVVCFRDQRGVPRKRSAATLAEARDLKCMLTADVKRGEYRPQSRISFADYALEWAVGYQGRTSRGIRPETLMDYKADLEREAIPFFAGLALADIEPRDLKRYAAHLAARGIAPSSVRNTLAPVRLLLATAYEDGLIRANPAARLRLAQPSAYQDPHLLRKALSEPELQTFLAALPAQWRLFFEFLSHTGLRIGEAIALTWDDIELDRRRLHVRRRLYRGRFDSPKSRYSIRTIPLAPQLTNALARHRAEQLDQSIVFPSDTGSYLDPSNIRRRVLAPAARTAGVPWIGFHTFRHTCATTLFRHGLNAKQIQAWLGHHSPAFTLATYVHLLPDDLPNADFLDHLTQPITEHSKVATKWQPDPPRTTENTNSRVRETRAQAAHPETDRDDS
jgi:integrase